MLIDLTGKIYPDNGVTLIDGNENTFWPINYGDGNNGDNPRVATIDLGKPYDLHEIKWFDYQGEGRFLVKVDGIIKVDKRSDQYQEWRVDDLNVTGQVIEIHQIENGCRVTQIELYGEVSDGPPPETINAPSSLVGQFSSGEQVVALSWNDNDDNGMGFKLERKEMNVGDFAQIAIAPTNAYTDQTTETNKTYEYRVKAYNQTLESGYSNIAQVNTDVNDPPPPSEDLSMSLLENNADGFTVKVEGALPETTYSLAIDGANMLNVTTEAESGGTDPNPPGIPTNLASSFNEEQSNVYLGWIAGSGGTPDGFKVERREGSGNFNQIADVSNSSYTDNSILQNKNYEYRVRAYNSDGNSGYSNIANVNTDVVAPPPTSDGDYTLIDDLISANWVIDNDEANGGTYNRPNLAKQGCVRLYMFGGDVTDGNPQNIYFDPTQGFGGKYRITDLVKFFESRGVHVQLSFRDNPEWTGHADGPAVYPQGSNTNDPASYHQFIHWVKDASEYLINQGIAPTAFSIAFGNEFMEHWKSEFEDWDASEIGALFVALEQVWPRGERGGVMVGSAGDVAWDTNQVQGIINKLQQHGVDHFSVDWYQTHIYWNASHAYSNNYKQGIDFSNKATMPEENPASGESPTSSGLRVFANRMVEFLHNFDDGIEVRIGEFGHDAGYPWNSVGNQDDGSPNIIFANPQRDTKLTKAEAGVRSYLAYSAVKGIKYCIWYAWDNNYNGGGGWLFGSSGMVDGDNTVFLPVFYYVQTMRNVLSGYRFKDIIQESGNTYHYRYENAQGNIAHAVWQPTRQEGDNHNYSFAVSKPNAKLVTISIGDEDGIESNLNPSGGQVTVQVNGTPKFIVEGESASQARTLTARIRSSNIYPVNSAGAFTRNAKTVSSEDGGSYLLTELAVGKTKQFRIDFRDDVEVVRDFGSYHIVVNEFDQATGDAINTKVIRKENGVHKIEGIKGKTYYIKLSFIKQGKK